MEQKHICASVCDRLPTLSANHPWLVDQNLEEDSRDHIVYNIRDPPSQHRLRIPSFLGRRIRGCSYGWVILSNHPHNDMWSLWNPESSNIIRLPRLVSKTGDRGSKIIQQCCLSSPPDDPGSILMVIAENYSIVFCRLDCNRKRLKWVEMSYAKQMRSIAGDDGFLYCITCCNGKVYALNSVPSNRFVMHIDIVVKGKEIVISLLPYLKLPFCYMNGCPQVAPFLKGCCTELFYIELGLNKVGHVEKNTFGGVYVFKLDMTNLRWEKMEDLKDAAFFLDLAHDYSVFYSPSIGSELRGYVHFLDIPGKVIHSFDFMNKTIALSSMPTGHASLLERRLQGESQQEHGKVNEMVVTDDEVDSKSMIMIGTREESMESRLLDIPFDALKTIMGFCAGVEYLNFRATCKQCHLAAPMIRWSKHRRLDTYSLVSPWLMLFDKDRGVISFTDPVFGDKYFIKTPRELIGDLEIHCSMCGWLLIRRRLGPLMFFNPFTSDIRELPLAPYFDTYYFSAPPTNPNCMVVGFTTRTEWHVYIHFVARELSSRRFRLNLCGDSHSFHFATLYRQNLYALYNSGGLGFIDTDNQDYTYRAGPWRFIDAGNLDYTWWEGPKSSCVSPKQSFLMKCDQQLLLVTMGEFGECVEVFKLNDSTEWEKTESLGRHTIYICGKACLCVEAKTAEMANKIYFPRFHSENKKIVFYSLATRRYHTSNIEESFGDFMVTKHHLDPHVWIEPSWC